MSFVRILLMTGGLFSVLALGEVPMAVAQEYSQTPLDESLKSISKTIKAIQKKQEADTEGDTSRVSNARSDALNRIRALAGMGGPKDWADMDPAFEFVIKAIFPFAKGKIDLWSDPKSCSVTVRYDFHQQPQAATVSFHLVNWKTLELYRDGVLARCVGTCKYGTKAKVFGGGTFKEKELRIKGIGSATRQDYVRIHRAMAQLARICPQSTTAY